MRRRAEVAAGSGFSPSYTSFPEQTTMSVIPNPTERGPHDDLTPSAAEPRSPAPATPPAESIAAGSGWLWMPAVAAALVAGVLAWCVGETMHDYYQPSAEAKRSRYDFSRLNREQAIADQKNASIAFGAFGGLLGLLVG